MINLKNVNKSFGNKHVLRDVSFKAERGAITGLVGPNGSGKTTTIRILTGFYDADSGEIEIDGKPMDLKSVLAKKSIGYAPESAPLYKNMTVSEYLGFVSQLRGVARSQRKSDVDQALKMFALAPTKRQLIRTLSKGYRHRVSLAQALLGDPPVIVLDEPTDGLDPLQKAETRRTLKKLAETKTILLTTHLLEEVESLCSRIVLINQGQIAFTGKVADVKLDNTVTTVVKVCVTGQSKGLLEKSLVGVEGLVSVECHEADGRTFALVDFKLSGDVYAALDSISLRLENHGLRIVELRCEESPLSMLFKPKSQSQ